MNDSIVTVPDIPVMYVEGECGRPIPEQAPEAFRKLEEPLLTLRGRKFYGVVTGDRYKACVAIHPDDDVNSLPHPVWVLPGGRYARRRVLNFQEDIGLIGATFESLRLRTDLDPSRPFIEYYRSQRELLAMVPVR